MEKKKEKLEKEFAFTKKNYVLLIIGILIIITGYLLMIGGKSPSPQEFHYEEIFSVRRITIAPIIVVSGYLFIIYSIMVKDKSN